ncbi:MAG: hypothetical protein Q7S89_00120 [bacterium]|nr:hypothetical protein [bacterium]
MRRSKNKPFLFVLFGGAVLIGFVIFGLIMLDEKRSPGGQIPAEVGQMESLRVFIGAANEVSGIQSGAAFNYSLTGYGNTTNFGIMNCRDEVRCDPVVEKQVAKFQQPNQPSPDTAEVDADTHAVVSLHRAVPSFVGGELPQEEVERIAREFLKRVYPEFETIESNLVFAPGMKGVRLNNGNYFFRWNDERYAIPGLDVELAPFVQVSITASGFIFGYDNTIQMYRYLSWDDLQKVCGYIEMPHTDDSMLDVQRSTVTVWFTDERGENRYVLLPYNELTWFDGCSESVKTFLEHIPQPPGV